MNKTHFTFLQNMYLKAPIQKLFPNTTIDVKENEANISMPIITDYLHAAKGLHGSVYFRLLDDAAFFAANSLEETYFVLTATFEVKLIKPVSSGLITSKGTAGKFKGSKIFANSTLFNEENEIIATGKGIFIRSRIELNSLID